MKVCQPRATLCLCCLLVGAQGLRAETIEDYQPLLENSPFLTQAFKDRLAKSEAAGINNYTFNGYVQLDGEWQLCLINKSTGIATWLKVNEAIEGYTLTGFTPKDQSLTFDKNGITATITMDKPK